MQCLGSNIFQIVQLAPFFIYRGQKQELNDIEWDQYVIKPQEDKSLNQLKYTDELTLDQQSEICMLIILQGLQRFDYPFFSENVLFNPYEVVNNEQAISVFEIRGLVYLNQVAITINPYKIETCKGNGLEKIERALLKINFKSFDKLKGRTLLPMTYISKQLNIDEVLWSEDCLPKEQVDELKNFYQTKHKVVIRDTSRIFKTDQTGKYKYIFAELCIITKGNKTIYNDCYSYVSKLKLWNQLISQNLQFLEFIKEYQIILTAKPQTFKLQLLDPGHLKFCEKLNKHLNQLVMSRSIQDFESGYNELFLGEKTLFTSNISLETWHVLTSAKDNHISQETEKKFLGVLQTILQKKKYNISQPSTIQFTSTDTIKEIIDKIAGLKTSMILVMTQKDVAKRISKELKTYCFQNAIPIQIIWLPFYEATCPQLVNRTIAKITGQIGSVPWTMDEINGRFLSFQAICFVGISIKKFQQKYVVALVLSVNKFITKFTSTFEVSENLSYGVKKCFKEALIVFNRSQKIFPDFICFTTETFEQISCKVLYDIVQETQDELVDMFKIQGQLYEKAFIVVTQLSSENIFRSFHLPDEEFLPQAAQNVTLGAYVQLSQNVYLLALQRDYNACPYMSKLEIYHESDIAGLEMQLLHLLYRLTFINCQLNFKTFLPVQLQYSFQLVSELIHSMKADELVDLKLSKVQMLSGKLFYI